MTEHRAQDVDRRWTVLLPEKASCLYGESGRLGQQTDAQTLAFVKIKPDAGIGVVIKL